MGIVISGFSNIGKSYLFKTGKYKCFDFDTTWFKKKGEWEEVYIECLLGLLERYDYVFITTRVEILNLLQQREIDFYLIYPERNLKDIYRSRAIERGSSEEFVTGFFSNWDSHISDCERNICKNKIILKEGQYLSDVIDVVVIE